MVLQAQLRKLGTFDIGSAADGVEALAALRASGAEPFDLMLTDIWMPNLDGEGLARAVRDDPALRGLRVVAVTADVEFPSKAAAAGFDGVLLKPVTADKLAAILSARRRDDVQSTVFSPSMRDQGGGRSSKGR